MVNAFYLASMCAFCYDVKVSLFRLLIEIAVGFLICVLHLGFVDSFDLVGVLVLSSSDWSMLFSLNFIRGQLELAGSLPACGFSQIF